MLTGWRCWRTAPPRRPSDCEPPRRRLTTRRGRPHAVAWHSSCRAMGPKWAGMGADLLADPIFARVVAEADALLTPRLGWSVAEELAAPAERSRMAATEIAQPTLFVVQLPASAVSGNVR
ncbi:acyltransferase domain-containing protein [Nocardia pseudobrasiliensis]|uniref:acyltransferase domain-containing protein n=1 Tax=Nocardia pseudobrasiliensis TaxID=45979 RepID=UPI0035A2464D